MGDVFTGTIGDDIDALAKIADNLPLTATPKKLGTGDGQDSSLYLGIDKVGFNEAVAMTKTSTQINATVDFKEAITKSTADINDLLTATIAASTYLTQSNASSTYLTQASAASTYFTIANASTSNISEGSNLYFTEARVLSTDLAGLSITGGAITSSDLILSAFGKLQNQINAVLGGAAYQGVWNATTNSPSLSSGVGTQGYYYVVSVAGSTNLDGITDWKVGDWAIYNGTTWDKVDNTDAVSSVDGMIGAVDLSATYQAKSANLTTYAGIAPSANVQTLLGAANYAAFKTSLSLNNVENTALSTWAGSTNITTLGTIGTGTWNATAITAVKGGTGQTGYAVGDILYASTTTALSKLAVGTNGHVLTLAGGVPTWAAPSGGGSGDMLLAGSQTITGYFDNSYTSVVSRPALHYIGSTFTGGTATTTKPHILIEPSGTTSTNWQTTGTYFGINGASGYTGYLIDAQINAVQKFAVSKDGIIVGIGSASLPSIRFTGWSANNGIYSNADGQIAITNSGTQSWIIAGFALNSNATRGVYLRQGTGAAATPTYAFNGDANTGVWSSGSDTIDFTTAGTNRVSMVNTRTTFLHRLNTSKGADVASANDLTLGSDGNVFIITGTTTINAILTTSWDAGAEVVLIFSGATTVKHNTAGGASTARIFLSGSVDLTTAANTILCLVYDGTQWQETSKKVA